MNLFYPRRWNSFLFLLLAFIGLATPSNAETSRLKIGLIGDSSVCLYEEENPRRGWGQVLPEFFKPGTLFINTAEGGRSSKTFPRPRWESVLKIKPDFILIQFGGNDQHAKTQPEATDAATDYKEYLRNYVKEARANGSVPILVTPLHRRLYESGHPTRELEPYANAMKEVAAELKVPVIDLYTGSGELYDTLGEVGSTELTTNLNDRQDRPDMADRTHTTYKGALKMAHIIAEGCAAADPRLKEALLSPLPY